MNEEINRYLGVFAFPFVDIHMLQYDPLQEYLDKKQFNVNDKKQIRKEVIKYLTLRYSIYNYDEIYLMLDKWYTYPVLDSEGKQIFFRTSFDKIFYYLQLFSKSLISQRDGKIVYKYWQNESDQKILSGFCETNKIYLFHSINRMFPLDILTTIYFLGHGKSIENLKGYYGGVEVSDSLLNTVLQRGLAENHLHSGVSMSFLSKWNDLMQPRTAKDTDFLKKEAQNLERTFYLNLAARTRMDLSLFLSLWEKIEEDKLKEYWKKSKQAKRVKGLEILFKSRKYLQNDYYLQGEQEKKRKKELISDLVDETLDYWNEALSECERYEIGKTGIIQSIYKLEVVTSDENIFLYKTLENIYRLKKLIQEDKWYEEVYDVITLCFLNYLRIKNFVYNDVVQQKSIHGLIYFQTFYGSNSSFGFNSSNSLYFYWINTIREQLQNQNMKKLELRCSLSKNESKNKNYLKNFFLAYRDILRQDYCLVRTNQVGEVEYIAKREFPRVALVVHLTKKEQNYDPEKCVEYKNILHFQYGEIYNNYKMILESFKKLRLIKGVDKYLVGLDVASLENAMPTWVFNGIYEDARDGKNEPMVVNGESFQSLGFTMHAGEDFRHIISGIRRIYEAIHGLKFHAGDRIGHGIALGLSPQNWYKMNQTVVLPRIEALENYLWAYMMLEKETKEGVYVNLSYLEKIIYKLATEIYGDKHVFTINTLVKAYEKLYSTCNIMEYIEEVNCASCHDDSSKINCNLVKKVGNEHFTLFDKCCGVNVWNVDELLSSMHCNFYVHKMNEPIHMKVTQQDINIAIEVQKLVREYVNEKGIMVEVNPSSNVVIADMDVVSDNQVYSINNCNYNFENILTCINSDDPSVFNTNVANEIGYIYFGMIEKGASREAVLQWIEKLRSTGMNGSFIKNNVSDQMLLHELDEIIDNL